MSEIYVPFGINKHPYRKHPKDLRPKSKKLKPVVAEVVFRNEPVPDFGNPPSDWNYLLDICFFLAKLEKSPTWLGRKFANDPRFVFDLNRLHTPRVPKPDKLIALWVWMNETLWQRGFEPLKGETNA